MAVRRDTVQLNVEFITDEAKNLAKTNSEVDKLTRELKKTVRNGGDVAGVMDKIAKAGGKVQDIDLSKVAPKALITRAKQLRQVLDQIPASAPGAAKLRAEYKKINDRLADMRKETRGVATAFSSGSGGLLSVLKRGQVAVIAFAAAFAAVVSSFQGIVRAAGLFQKFGAVLTNTLGSRSAARKALNEVTELADQLNIPADEVIGSYVKLVNRGIKPTTEEMTRLLDLAASQGKSLDQLAEGALDAATGEFERLKEFGIRAKAQGDLVELTFKGQTQTVAKTQDAILGVLLGYGELAGVQGSAAATSDNLAAKQDKLNSIFERLLANLGQGGLGEAIGALLDNATDLLKIFVDLTDVQEGLTDEVKGTQAAFNLEIETLKRGNLSAEARASLIETINTKYGDYLPNLLDEESTLGDIARAQELVNRAFEQKIILLAAEEQLTDISKRRLQAKKEELDLELELTAAKERTIDADKRAANSGNTQGFAGTGAAKGIFGQAAADDLAAKALDRLNDKKQEQIDLEKEFQQSLAAAKALGLDINSILDPPASGLSGGSGGGGGGASTLSKRLKEIEEASARLRALADRERIQSNLSEEEAQKVYIARLGKIREDDFAQQLQAYATFGKQRVAAAEELRNELIALEIRRAESGRLAVGTIDEERAKINEAPTDSTIAPLTDEEEIARAEALAEKLLAIDKELVEGRITLAQREADIKRELEASKLEAANDGVDAIVEILGRDEEARKKNAVAIKSFQVGQATAAGFAEIQQIALATAAQTASTSAIPGGVALVPGIIAAGKLRQIGAAIRTAINVGKIIATKFERGGRAKSGTFGGNRHSNGGTRGVFEDGTHIEVEAGEDFFILNRNASAERARLSALNQRHGGVPFFADGGSVFSSPNTTPTIPANVLSSGGAGGEATVAGIAALLDAFRDFPTTLKANVVYSDITQAGDDLSTVSAASQV